MLQREKAYLLKCASNEDLNQPAHSRSLIRVFIIHMKKKKQKKKKLSLSAIQNAPGEDSDQTAHFRWAHMSVAAPLYMHYRVGSSLRMGFRIQ